LVKTSSNRSLSDTIKGFLKDLITHIVRIIKKISTINTTKYSKKIIKRKN